MQDEDLWVLYNNALSTNQNVRKMYESLHDNENVINHNMRKQHQAVFAELARQHNGVGEFLEEIGNALQNQHETILSLFGAIIEPRADPTNSINRRLQQVTNETFDLDSEPFGGYLPQTNYSFPDDLLGDDGKPESILRSQVKLAQAVNESTASLQKVVDNSTAAIQQVVTTVEESIKEKVITIEESIKKNVDNSTASIQQVVSIVEGSLKVSNSSLSIGENIGKVRVEMSGVHSLNLDIECVSQSDSKATKSSPLPAAIRTKFLVRSTCFGSECAADITNVQAVYSVIGYDGVSTVGTRNHTAADFDTQILGEGLQHIFVVFHTQGAFKAEDTIMFYITAEQKDGEGKTTESARPFRSCY